jgi:hypothetical protein
MSRVDVDHDQSQRQPDAAARADEYADAALTWKTGSIRAEQEKRVTKQETKLPSTPPCQRKLTSPITSPRAA